MLNSNKPKRVVSQAPLKDGLCHAGCGAAVQYRTNPKIICSDCKPEWRARQTRAAAETQRRKKGVPQTKGKQIACHGCGKTVTLNRSTRAKYCPDCALTASRDRARTRVRRLCRERGAPAIGAEAECRHCGTKFTRTGARNYLCPPCGDKSVRRTLTEDQREKSRVYQREWVRTPTGRSKAKGYQRQSRVRRKSEPSFTINERMSAGIRYSLVAGKQGSSWQNLVPYTLTDLVVHLERQFLPGMSWENRGDWHIDHIRPLASFEFTTPDCPQFREAWALTNLRPLWAKDNLSKNARRTHLL